MILLNSTIENESLLTKFISFALPFLLGLFASLLVDKLRSFQKNKRNKNFILLYLKDTITPTLTELEESYKIVRDRVEDHKIGVFKTHAFENFNTKVLSAITPVEYYAIFKERYVLFNEIETMIDYISNFLPIKMSNDYWNYLDEHLRLNNKIDDCNHIETCNVCISYKKLTITNFDSRIEETKSLVEKIKKLTSTAANKELS